MAKIPALKPTIQMINIYQGTKLIPKTGTERLRGRHLSKIRRRIMARDAYTCQSCGIVTRHGEVDHIVQLSRGGLEDDSNRQYLCVECHKEKTAREAGEKDHEAI